MRLPLIAAGLLLFVAASPVCAQEVAETDSGVQASVDMRLGAQRLSRGTVATAAARLWLHFGENWRVGFGGVRGLNRSDNGDLASSGLEATFGMATVTGAAELPVPGGLEVALTLGSGAVSLENSLLGTTLDTETVWALEPSLGRRFYRLGPVDVAAEVGYRWIFGSEGLSRLQPSDLNTLSLEVVLSFDRL